MGFLKDKKYVFVGGALAALFIFWMSFGGDSGAKAAIFVTPEKGTFEINVTTSGELRAKNSTSIRGPEGIREFRIFRVPILRLVPEGTVVEKGDFVAELDRSEITGSLQD